MDYGVGNKENTRCLDLTASNGATGGLRVDGGVAVADPNPMEGFHPTCRNEPVPFVAVRFGQRVGVERKPCQCYACERPGEVA